MAFSSSSRLLALLKSSLRLPSSYTDRLISTAYRGRRPFSTLSDASSSSSSPAMDMDYHTDTDAYYSDSDSDIHSVSQGDEETNPHGFDFKLDNNAAKIRVELPGVDKQNLKVWFDKEAMNFEASTEDKDFGIESFCEGAVEMPHGLLELLKVKETRVDLKNGVLKVVIPKLQLEERSDVFIVNLSS